MEERVVRSRLTWIVGLVLATAFVATIIWSVAQDADDDGPRLIAEDEADELDEDEDGFQVLGRSAEGEDRYRYLAGGTYTVALEALGANAYEQVSNTVTITC